MKKRNRRKPQTAFKDRLLSFARDARQKASLLPAGAERRDLLARASQADTTAHLDDWISSPGLQRPK